MSVANDQVTLNQGTDAVEDTGKSLLEAILSGASISSIVDPFVSSCKGEGDYKETLVAILNMVLRVAGVSASIDVTHLGNEDDMQNVLEEVLAREVMEDAVCLLISRDSRLKRLKKGFQEFFSRLIQSCYAAGLLTDDGVVEQLRIWLSAMNESKARTFRHAASVALYGCLDGVIDTMVSLDSSVKVATKKKEAAALTKRREDLRVLSECFFSCSLHNRIKDVAPEIRLLAQEKLRLCFFSLPDLYLQNHYFRYLRVGLHDNKAENRAEALEALFLILSTIESGPEKLIDFLQISMSRIVEMCKDVDTKCVYSAIKVCTSIIKHNLCGNDGNFLISNEQLDVIFSGLLDDRNVVRLGTGSLLKVFIDSKAEEMQQTSHPKASLLTALINSQSNHLDGFSEDLIVDALWKKEEPPEILTDFEPYIGLCTSSEVEESAAGLRLVACLLRRFSRSETDLGPAPKDDLSITMKSKSKGDIGSKLEKYHGSLSKSVVEVLPGILSGEKTAATLLPISDILANIAYKHGKATVNTDEAVEAFYEASLECSMTVEEVMQTGVAWRKIAFHGGHKEILNSYLKVVLEKVSKSGKTVGAAAMKFDPLWSRLLMLSSLVALDDQWELFVTTLERSSANPALFHQQYCSAVACFYSIIWDVSRQTIDKSVSDEFISNKINVVLPTMLAVAQGPSAAKSLPVLKAKTLVLISAMDLAALPQSHLSDDLSNQIIASIGLLINDLSSMSTELQEQLNVYLSIANYGTVEGAEEVVNPFFEANKFKSALTEVEACCCKLVSSATRLFALSSISSTAAPTLLASWTKTGFKSCNDLFKSLFHTMRDKSGDDGFNVEKNTILHALDALPTPVDPASQAFLHHLGNKLASMHFTLTDKHYSACMKMVDFGLEFSKSNDLVLAAVTPYCSKLLKPDAVAMVNRLKQHPVEGLEDSVLLSNFTSAIYRAAKMEDPSATKINGKRLRGSAGDDDVEAAAPSESSPSKASRSESGWRGKGGATTDLSSATTMAADTGVTLLATQEWDDTVGE